MARVTLFTRSDCPDSKVLAFALERRKIPFREISLSERPQRWKDMFVLSESLVVPQAFINSEHIGGKDAMIDWLERTQRERPAKSPLEAFEDAASAIQARPNPRLRIPTRRMSPGGIGEIGRRSSQSFISSYDEGIIALPKGKNKMVTVRNITETLKLILPMASLKYNMTTYSMSFTGHAAVQALQQYFRISPKKAEAFGKQLVAHKVLHHVCYDHDFEDTPKKFYRLQCYQTPDILNSYKLCPTEESNPSSSQEGSSQPSNLSLVHHMQDLLRDIESGCMMADGRIDYQQAANHAIFSEFEDAASELQLVKIGRMSDKMILAFSLSVYRVMLKYAYIKVGIGKTQEKYATLLDTVKFNVGGSIYTFNDWLHGVVRGNRPVPSLVDGQIEFGEPVFEKSDPRSTQIPSPQTLDHRIHFLLWMTAPFSRCSPVLSTLSETYLADELSLITQAVCECNNNVQINGDNAELRLPRAFQLFSSDFGVVNIQEDFPKLILQYLQGSKKEQLEELLQDPVSIEVSFHEETEWFNSIGIFEQFDVKAMKADIKSVFNLVKSKPVT